MFRKQVDYLGRTVSQEGYTLDERNVEAVRGLLDRTYDTVLHVRQLLGLLGFHRRHIQDYASISKPLSDLLVVPELAENKKKGQTQNRAHSSQKIKWEPVHQKALEKLVHFATNPPILVFPDMQKPFFIHVDASGLGLGAILFQEQEGMNRVIGYGSRTLKPCEKNYHSTKLELLAMKWAITEKFRDYLSYSDGFKVYSDNNPLLFLMSNKKPNSTIQRWVSELAEFKFTVHFRAGVINRDADCLSRLPLDIDQYVELCKEETSLDIFQVMLATVQVNRVAEAVTIRPEEESGKSTEKGAAEEMRQDQSEDSDIARS